MLETLMPIMAAIESGDKKLARRLLRPLLERNPGPEVWYLASQVCETPDHEIACLQRVLALDPIHGKARSRLLTLRQNTQASPLPTQTAAPTKKPLPNLPTAPTPPPPAPADLAETLPDRPTKPELSREELKSLKRTRRPQKKRGVWTYVGCFAMILMSITASYFVLTVLGSSIPGLIRGVLTGSGPVTEIDGTPLSDRPDAVYVVEPSQRKFLERSDTVADALEPGYAHAYTFDARNNEELAIYVQFISMTAHGVSRNVAVFDPSGADAADRCGQDNILQDNSGIVFICNINQNGLWQVRIFGREGESTGAYTVQVTRFQ